MKKGMQIHPPFSWCSENRHQDCRQKYRRSTTDRGKFIWIDEIVYCGCQHPGCICFLQDKVPYSPKLRRVVDVQLPEE